MLDRIVEKASSKKLSREDHRPIGISSRYFCIMPASLTDSSNRSWIARLRRSGSDSTRFDIYSSVTAEINKNTVDETKVEIDDQEAL